MGCSPSTLVPSNISQTVSRVGVALTWNKIDQIKADNRTVREIYQVLKNDGPRHIPFKRCTVGKEGREEVGGKEMMWTYQRAMVEQLEARKDKEEARTRT